MTRPNTTIVKTPRPVYYLMGKQAQGNSHPGSWSVLESSTDSNWILDQMAWRYNQSSISLFYTDLAIHLDMGSIDLTKGKVL